MDTLKAFEAIIFDDFDFDFIEEHIDTIEEVLKMVLKNWHVLNNFPNIKTLLDVLIEYDSQLEQNNHHTVYGLIEEYHKFDKPKIILQLFEFERKLNEQYEKEGVGISFIEENVGVIKKILMYLIQTFDDQLLQDFELCYDFFSNIDTWEKEIDPTLVKKYNSIKKNGSIQEQIKELDLEIEAKMKLREYLYNQL